MDDPIKIIKQADELRDKANDLNKAISILEELLKEVKKDPIILSFYIPAIMKKLGNLYSDMGETEKAKKIYKEALKIAVNDLNKIEETDILVSMAFLELKTGDIEKAYKYATKRGEYIWNKRGEKFAIAKSNAFAVLGNIHFEKGEYKKAMYAYKRGLATAKFFKYTKREITILGDIANLYIVMGDYSNAQKKLNIALEKAEKEYFIALPSIYLRKSNVCLANREFEKAKKHIDKALEKAKELGLARDIKEAEEALNNYFNLMQD